MGPQRSPLDPEYIPGLQNTTRDCWRRILGPRKEDTYVPSRNVVLVTTLSLHARLPDPCGPEVLVDIGSVRLGVGSREISRCLFPPRLRGPRGDSSIIRKPGDQQKGFQEPRPWENPEDRSTPMLRFRPPP